MLLWPAIAGLTRLDAHTLVDLIGDPRLYRDRLVLSRAASVFVVGPR
jgi:hypothetical protein